jgi:hypothetical protein
MSTIRVDNFGPSAGGTTYSALGVSKAWGNANLTVTPAILRSDSNNISSLTDAGTGQAHFNLTNAMSSSDYTVLGSSAGYDYGMYSITSTRFQVGTVSSTGTFADGSNQSGAIFGVLA